MFAMQVQDLNKIQQRGTHRRVHTALLAATLVISLRGVALSDTDFQGAINYDFRAPGARSLALGGAFTALADDATASLVNPAGLSQLRKQEISFAAKAWGDDLHLDWGNGSYVDLSAFSQPPPNPQYPKAFREERDFWSTRAGPSFVSYVLPFKRLSLSLFGAQLANSSNSFTRDQIVAGPYFVDICLPSCARLTDTFETALTRGQGKLRLQRYGLSGSFAFNSKFSAGITIFQGAMRFSAKSTRYERAPSINTQVATLILEEEADDRDVGYGAGLHYHGNAWNFGLAYQKGETFKVHVNPKRGPRGAGITGIAAPFDTEMRVPDKANLGASYRPNPLITISAEIEAIKWSKMAEDLVSFHPQEYDVKFRMDDAYNPHLGAEYVLLADTSPLSVRAGIWWEKGHRLEYVGQTPDSVIDIVPGLVTVTIPGATIDAANKMLFPGGGSQQHFTAGIGFVVGHLQFDAGYDYAKWNRQFAVSTIFRF